MSRTSPKLTAPSTTATTPTAAMLGGPLLCTREPTHSANSGPPVQMLIVVRLIAQTRAMRSIRTRTPVGQLGWPSIEFTYIIVSRYTLECEDHRPRATLPSRASGAHARRPARRRRARVRPGRLPGLQRGCDRRGSRLLPRRVLLELRLQGGAVRGTAPGARVRSLPRHRRRGQRRSRAPAHGARARRAPGRDAASPRRPAAVAALARAGHPRRP